MPKYEEKPCKCGSHFIANRTHWLCFDCNYSRIHGESRFEANLRKLKSKPNKIYSIKRKSLKTSKNTLKKRKEVLEKDRKVYFEVFSNTPHECEECGIALPDEFKDLDGNINAIYQYSHILTKGAYPQHRHNPNNFNRLCLEHHQQWEFGDRESMKIYGINLNKIWIINKKS